MLSGRKGRVGDECCVFGIREVQNVACPRWCILGDKAGGLLLGVDVELGEHLGHPHAHRILTADHSISKALLTHTTL